MSPRKLTVWVYQPRTLSYAERSADSGARLAKGSSRTLGWQLETYGDADKLGPA